MFDDADLSLFISRIRLIADDYDRLIADDCFDLCAVNRLRELADQMERRVQARWANRNKRKRRAKK